MFSPFPGSADGPWSRDVHEPDARGIGTVCWPRIVPKDPDCAALLAKRTLTNLYNQAPSPARQRPRHARPGSLRRLRLARRPDGR